MRKKLVRAAKLTVTLLAAVLSSAILFLLWHAPSFSGGESYTLSLGQSSSARMVTMETPPLVLPPEVRGESTVYEGSCAEEFLAAYRARVLFTEEAAGTVSCYCYSPYLGEGILLNGVCVNLHIAEGEGRTAVGTPVIFGGF